MLTGDLRAFDIHLPTQASTRPGGAPMIFYIHGGVWHTFTQETEANMDLVFNRLDQGFAVGIPDFHQACEIDPQTGEPHLWPTPILDILWSMILMHEAFLPNHPHLGIDADSFGLLGTSTGGHLALTAAAVANNIAPDRIPIKAVASVYGAFNLNHPRIDEMAATSTTLDANTFLGAGISGLLGCPGELDTCSAFERYFAGPQHFLDASDPPTYVMHGKADVLSPWEAAEEFYGNVSSARGLGSGDPADRYRNNGVDMLYYFLSDQRINLGGPGCLPNGGLVEGDHGCLSGDPALSMAFAEFLFEVLS